MLMGRVKGFERLEVHDSMLSERKVLSQIALGVSISSWNLLPCLYIAISLYVLYVAAASLGFACMIPARQGVLEVV